MSEARLKEDLRDLRDTSIRLRKERESAVKGEKRSRGLWAFFGY